MTKPQLTRKEKEKLVVELYKEGKTYAQIAKEAHVSLRDIGPILGKAGILQTQSILSRVFELYSQGKPQVQVAIILGIEADEAIRLYREYMKLLGCSEFVRVYPRIKDDPWSYVNLIESAMESQMDTKHITKLLHIANSDLPSVELKFENLKKETGLLESDKINLNGACHRLRDDVSSLNETKGEVQLHVDHLRREVADLNQQKVKIENFVKNFQNNPNEVYINIRQTVRRDIESIVSNPRRVLRLAVCSILESESKHPGKLLPLYYNVRPSLSVEQLLLSNSSATGNDLGHHRNINDDSLEKLMIDEAEQIYNRTEEALTNKAITNSKESSSQLRLSDMLPSLSTDENHYTEPDLDTPLDPRKIKWKFEKLVASS